MSSRVSFTAPQVTNFVELQATAFTFFRYPLHQNIRLNARDQTSHTQDEATFRMLAESFQLNHPKMTGALCEGQMLPAVVNGAEWKKLSGALMDYVYFKEGTLMVRTYFASHFSQL